MMSIAKGELEKTYQIISVETNDEELDNFLFTLGCYTGEKITLISKTNDNYVIVIKDSRYNIDKALAEVIKVA